MSEADRSGRYAGSVATSAAYGRRVESVDEWIVKENMAAMECELALHFIRGHITHYTQDLTRSVKCVYSIFSLIYGVRLPAWRKGTLLSVPRFYLIALFQNSREIHC